MLKLLNIFFLFLLANPCDSVFAQGGWKKKYYLQNSSSSVCENVIEAPFSNYIMMGNTTKSDGTGQLSLVGIDVSGNVQWRKDYGTNKLQYIYNFLSPHAAIVQDQSFFYNTRCVRDSNNNQVGVLLKFNYNGDTIWQKVYRETAPKDVIPQGLCRSVDNGLLITGASQEPGGQTCLLIKTDLNGNELWRKRIAKNTAPYIHDGKGIVQDSATKKIFIVGYQYIGNSTTWSTYSNILILDSLGNKLVQTSFNNADGGGFGSIIQLRDKSLVTCGSYLMLSGATNKYKGLVVKFDTSGSVVWSETYDVASPYNSIAFVSEIANSDLILTGDLDTMQNYINPPTIKIRVNKIDKNGHKKWAKYIGSAYNTNLSEGTLSLNRTQDKGFIIANGHYYSNNPDPYMIIKIDSTGCDTLEQYCTNIELGFQEIRDKRQGVGLSICPNPATDVIEIKAESYFDKALRIKISDLSGRELEALELNPQETLKINTGRYAAGVYFVNALYEGKTLESRKLLIVK